MDNVVYGIQGGRGSFNEEAINFYLKSKGINKKGTVIKYLYTTDGVLNALDEGKIDYGQFAAFNSAGGMVEESLKAMASHIFKISDTFSIKIAHAMMIRKDADLEKITTTMAHPQVLAQCRKNLARRHPDLRQTSGTGRMIDSALVAKALAEKKLPKTVAVMGSRVLAEIYRLKAVDDNLQDIKENYTTFLIVEK